MTNQDLHPSLKQLCLVRLKARVHPESALTANYASVVDGDKLQVACYRKNLNQILTYSLADSELDPIELITHSKTIINFVTWGKNAVVLDITGRISYYENGQLGFVSDRLSKAKYLESLVNYSRNLQKVENKLYFIDSSNSLISWNAETLENRMEPVHYVVQENVEDFTVDANRVYSLSSAGMLQLKGGSKLELSPEKGVIFTALALAGDMLVLSGYLPGARLWFMLVDSELSQLRDQKSVDISHYEGRLHVHSLKPLLRSQVPMVIASSLDDKLDLLAIVDRKLVSLYSRREIGSSNQFIYGLIQLPAATGSEEQILVVGNQLCSAFAIR